jgi:hypothetical protein
LIRNTRLYEKIDALSKKRKAEDSSSNGNTSKDKRSKGDDGTVTSLSKNGQEIFFRPTPQVLDAVKKLAKSISQALSMPEKQLEVHSGINGTEEIQSLVLPEKQLEVLEVHSGMNGSEESVLVAEP